MTQKEMAAAIDEVLRWLEPSSHCTEVLQKVRAALEAEPLMEWRALIHIALDGSGFAFFDEPPKPVGMGRDRHCRVAIYADA